MVSGKRGRSAWAAGLGLLLASCVSEGDPPPFLRDDAGPGVLPDGGSVPDFGDSDGDGLCNVTEDDLGSDPDSNDSDGDRLPDFIEAIYGFVPTDPSSPQEDQLARLAAVEGAQTSWPVRLSANGKPSDFIGVFENIPAPYDDGSSAGTFFVSSSAIGCEPPDAVRGIEPERQRFVLALGPVRLELGIELRYSGVIDTSSCARAYPFQYFIKNDEGEVVADGFYLLLVTVPGADGPDDYCKPALCI